MKKIFISLVILFIAVFISSATVRTVSNNADNPAQFSAINSAINVSADGDTILVFGSDVSYGTVNLDRTIVLIGAGYHNTYGGNSIISTLNIKGGTFNASNSKISGFYIENLYFRGNEDAAKLIENVLIERCRLQYVIFYDKVTYRNDTIRNCLLKNSYVYFYDYLVPYQNIQIHNNIFDNEYFYSYNNSYVLDSVYVRNCVFLNRAAPNTIFSRSKYLTIENSIFYAAEPQGCLECAFNHNMTYANTNNVLVGTGNPGSVGSNNQEDVNPEFEIYPIGGGPFSYDQDLNVNNPLAKTGGAGGTEMGIYGGMLPYEPGLNPSIPQMTEITFPGDASSVKIGGTLNVTFKAKKQD